MLSESEPISEEDDRVKQQSWKNRAVKAQKVSNSVMKLD